MRAFIAVPVPGPLQEKIAAVQTKLASADAKITFVEPKVLHFCLKFLGEVPDSDIQKLKDILERVANQTRAFDLRVAGVGAFPSKDYVRAIWLGCREGSQELTGLAADLETRCQQAGFRPEARPFTPHLTLGRVKFVRDKEALARSLEGLATVDIGVMRVDSIKLIKSTLAPTGPIYEELHSAALR